MAARRVRPTRKVGRTLRRFRWRRTRRPATSPGPRRRAVAGATFAAVAQLGRLRGHRLGHALGLKCGKMPCAKTLAKLPRGLDAGRRAGGSGHVAIDGEVSRGSRDGTVPGVGTRGRGRRGGHDAGRGRVEARTPATSTWLREYRADWPGLARVCRLTRGRTARGVTTTETEAMAEDLLDPTPAHWGTESGLHQVRDVTLGEDKCRVRRGQPARVPASLRDAAMERST